MAQTVALEQPLQQKDNLCGPFWAARILHAAGIEEWDGEPVDEDLVALRARTVLPEPDEGSVPRGAESRTAYRFELPRVPPAESGTAAGALADAIERASQGALRVVPARGEWTPQRVVALVEAAAVIDGARLLANVRTGSFWGTRPPVDGLLAELRGEEVEGPPAEWDVGHFCELALLVRGPGGTLVVVHDSYPSFGRDGRHLQPPRALARALARGDGREGGVLVVVPGERGADAEALVRDVGLEIGIWDNGTREVSGGDH
jgi:Family of unknown function (DUF6885)